MKQKMIKKAGISLIILLIGIFSYTGLFESVFIEKTFVGGVDRHAQTYLDKTMKKALFTFAVVRGINAVISVVQESDLAVSPAGVGITIAVGEILDPVNDLIERFSWVMLASTTSLGVQRILMTIAVWLGFRVLLSFSMLAILIGLWFPGLFKSDMKSTGYRIVLLAVLVRFCIPAVAIATSQIDALFLDEPYSQATQNLEKARDEIQEGETSEEIADDERILGRIRNYFEGIKDSVNLEKRIQHVKATVSHYIEYIIDLIVVFILQTIFIPLLILWILARLFSSILNVQLEDSLKSLWNKTIRKPRPTLAKK